MLFMYVYFKIRTTHVDVLFGLGTELASPTVYWAQPLVESSEVALMGAWSSETSGALRLHL